MKKIALICVVFFVLSFRSAYAQTATAEATLTPTVTTTPTPTESITPTTTTSPTATPTPTQASSGTVSLTSTPTPTASSSKKEVLGSATKLGSTSNGVDSMKWIFAGIVAVIGVAVGLKVIRTHAEE